MAAEATHIRLAVDLKDELKVKNIEAYISGSLYPDSRYITKIGRELTHNNDLIDKNFVGDDDFRKGWALHLVVDKAQNEEMNKAFPELNVKQDDYWWTTLVAIRIIQDIDDAKSFDLQKYINFSHLENPNGEDLKKVKNYYHITRNMYRNKKEISIKEYQFIWMSFGIGDHLSNEIIEKIENYLKDDKALKKISKLYINTLKRIKRKYLLKII